MSFDPASGVTEALKREKLIPNVIPETFIPSMLFSIIYPGGNEVILGNELSTNDTAEEPDISFAPLSMPVEQADSEGDEVAYTLVMFDPDVPTRADPQYKTFRHWVITGLQSPADSSAATANSAALKIHPSVTPYRPPGPRPASGVHRYTFLLFQEPSSKPFSIPPDAPERNNDTLESRRHWNAIDFAEKYGLKLVGANFMLITAPPATEE
ncbi:PEBP-like protein [Irpex rosettiformis]|uniref:PEBP-like protein n=1 Tax=Irpex rosettiformis TaxID=378272 RepID=A0ACB8TRG4_9APHY|nr:PEBP-like protein [Irpex rosettiformis]